MKKYILIVLMIIFTFALSACSGDQPVSHTSNLQDSDAADQRYPTEKIISASLKLFPQNPDNPCDRVCYYIEEQLIDADSYSVYDAYNDYNDYEQHVGRFATDGTSLYVWDKTARKYVKSN